MEQDRGREARLTREVETAMRGIVHHVHHHPAARDSSDGVRLWWLPEGGAGLSRQAVETALERLVAEGRLDRRRVAGVDLYGSPPPPPEAVDG
jgi:hypothetical protein